MRALPAEGRKGDPPVWPLEGQTEREAELWYESWSMPQAVAWEEQRLEWTVAMYVRSLTHAEKPDSTPPARTLVRQFMDDLGLTAGGMAKNGWKVAATAEEPDEVPDEGSGMSGQSARERLKLVDGVA